MSHCFKAIGWALALTAVLLPAREESFAPPPARNPEDFRFMIKIAPVGLLFGQYGGGVQALLTQRQSLSLDGGTGNGQDFEGNAFGGYGVTLNWRWHFREGMESNYIGLFAKHGDFSGDFTEGQPIGPDIIYDYDYQAQTFGINYGNSNIWFTGFSLIWRIGLGVPIFNFQWENGQEPSKARDVEAAFKLVSIFDGEFMIGWAF